MATKGSRESLRRFETSMLTAVVPVTATEAPVSSRRPGAASRMSRTSWSVRTLSGPEEEDGDDALRRVARGLGRQNGLDVLEGAQLLGHLSAGL